MTCTANRVRQLVELLSPISLAFSQFTKERAISSSAKPNGLCPAKGSSRPCFRASGLAAVLQENVRLFEPSPKAQASAQSLTLSSSAENCT